MTSAGGLLQLVGVSKRFDSVKEGRAVDVLREVNLEVAAGETLAIVGPSGSGKSTLLNIMGTLDQPSAGQVLLAGRDLSALDENGLAQVRNREIGFVFQSHHLLPYCSVLENVLVPMLADSTPAERAAAEQRGRALLGEVGLSARLGHRPGELSGGERQRVAVVRALIRQPRLLLADEPTGALDRATAQELGELLVALNRDRQVTLVVVTHALDLAHRMSRQLELRDGVLSPFPNP